jgi:hypothetical protein
MVSNTLTLVFSGIVAISTGVYAILTWRLTSETRKMREAQTTPNVLVTVDPEDFHDLYLVVRNVGLAPAYNIKFAISPDLVIIKDYRLSKVGFIKDGLSILAPGQEIKTFLYSPSIVELKNQIDTVLNIEILYESIDKKQIRQNYQIDLSQFKGIITVTTTSSYENDLLRGIQDIAKAIEKISDEGLRTVIYKSIDEKEEDNAKYWKKVMEESEKKIEEFKKGKEK